MFNTRGINFLTTGFFVFILFFANCAHAVELNGCGMGPTIVDMTVKPGNSFEQAFTVRNNSDVQVQLETYLQDFFIEGDQWNIVENPDNRWSPMTWAAIIDAPAKLGPKEHAKVRIRFDVPSNAEMGEHVTYFNSKFIPFAGDDDDAQKSGIVLASEIRSLIYIKVTDADGNLDILRSWQLKRAGTNFCNFGKPVFTINVANTGNVHLEVRGNIAIFDGIRNQKTELNIPLFNILPNEEKRIDLPWEKAPFLGYFNGTMSLTYDGENFEEREFSFITVPLLTLLGVVLSISAVILAVALHIRKLQKRLAAAEKRQDNNPGV